MDDDGEDVMGGEPESEGEYNSGPFCRHWSDPSDCDLLCVCGHKCCDHRGDECSLDDCECEHYEEEP
jgi:hypothetical protein